MSSEEYTAVKTKKLFSRMDVIKRAETISSSKPPIHRMTAVMLLVKQRSMAELKVLVNAYITGGLVYTLIMMILIPAVNAYIFHLVVDLVKCTEEHLDGENLQLDYTESLYYVAKYKFRWNSFIAKTFRFVIDLIVVFQKITAGILSLVFSLREISLVANNYGNDFTEQTLCWYAIIPVMLLLLIGSCSMLAIIATVGNVISLIILCYQLYDASSGLGNISRRKMFPDTLKDSISTYGDIVPAYLVSFSALTVRNEMSEEYSCEKPLGALNIAFSYLALIHTVVPGARYIKYGENRRALAEKHDYVFQLSNLMIALEKLLAIPMDIYIAFHCFFPGLYTWLQTKHGVRWEFASKLAMTMIMVVYCHYSNAIELKKYINMTLIPFSTLMVPIAFHIIISQGSAKRVFNMFLLLVFGFQVSCSMYYCVMAEI